MEIYEKILQRESVRDFAGKPVDAEILKKILEAGRWAPSTQNRQCWRYIVLQDKENIRKLSMHTGLLGTVNFFIAKAPVLIIACADPQKSLKINGQDYYLVDTAISFQQMMLAAWGMGIGSCWLAAFNESKVKDYLKIPDNIRVVAMSPFGYPAKKKSIYSHAVKGFAGSRKRIEIDKTVFWEKWNNKEGIDE